MGITLTQLTNSISKVKDYVVNKTNKISIAQKTVNSNLDYAIAKMSKTKESGITVGFVVPFDTIHISNNVNFNTINYSFHLQEGKTYEIESFVRHGNAKSHIYYGIYDKTNDKFIQNIVGVSETTDNSWDVSTPTKAIITTTEDIDIQIKITSVGGLTNGQLQSTASYFKIQEIGRNIVIDPLEYVNKNQGIEDTPVGHIISYMGIITPKHYLPCDGIECNIADYPYLAQHIIDNYGSVNYFGGDGINTFATPIIENDILQYIKYEPTYYMTSKNTNYLQPSLYSEKERIIGSWIDGKPLYQKVIKTTSSFELTTKWYKWYNASELNIDFLVHGYFGRNDNEYPDSMNDVSLYYNVAEQYIHLLRASGNLQCPNGCIVVIEYTKTTDAENSFTTNMIKDYIVSGNNYTTPSYGNNSNTYTNEEVSTVVNKIFNLEVKS